MSLATSGHGFLISIEKDGDPAGSFTTIAELAGDLGEPSLERPWAEATPHQDTIDSGVTGVLKRGAITFEVNLIEADSTHDHLTGLEKRMYDNDFFGIRFLGPGGSAGSDEVIASGHVTALDFTSPVREGVRTMAVTIKLSKQQIVDGVSIGVAA